MSFLKIKKINFSWVLGPYKTFFFEFLLFCTLFVRQNVRQFCTPKWKKLSSLPCKILKNFRMRRFKYLLSRSGSEKASTQNLLIHPNPLPSILRYTSKSQCILPNPSFSSNPINPFKAHGIYGIPPTIPPNPYITKSIQHLLTFSDS